MNTNRLKTLLAEKGLNITALADQLGLNKTSVWRWNEKRVPIERVAEVERLTGIPREHLRPDVFKSPSKGEAA